MKITANFATYNKRKHTIDKAVESIIDQVDEVRVHYNDYLPEKKRWNQWVGGNFTDRAKFMYIQPDEIAFTCDDDIIYPPDYVETTLSYLEKYGGIVTYHGRLLQGTGLRYYYDHKSYHFKYQEHQDDTNIDVPGTGCMAFYSNDFTPYVLDYPQNKMVDLLIGLEAAIQDVSITCVRHKTRWIDSIRTMDAIYKEFKNDCGRQNELADRIYQMKSPVD